MNAQALGKRLVSPLTDGEIGRIISLKAIGFSTMEISRMLSRNESTIRSFLKKWNSQGVFRSQVRCLKRMPERTR
jgi:IS30 family transposase